jgi:hypothetical protein
MKTIHEGLRAGARLGPFKNKVGRGEKGGEKEKAEGERKERKRGRKKGGGGE